jgi:hypothetical protein
MRPRAGNLRLKLSLGYTHINAPLRRHAVSVRLLSCNFTQTSRVARSMATKKYPLSLPKLIEAVSMYSSQGIDYDVVTLNRTHNLKYSEKSVIRNEPRKTPNLYSRI